MSSGDHPGQRIALPQGGGAMAGMGETFAPDLHTGTGNFTVPLALPPGRGGLQPALSLAYSTGGGNGPFGLGWGLGLPGVSRKTSGGVPRYNDRAGALAPGEPRDVFILSGAEDLTPVALWAPAPARPGALTMIGGPGDAAWPNAPVVQYRPRTEGLFARIFYHRGEARPYWRVEGKDGLVSVYGAKPGATGPSTIAPPDDPGRVFAWKLTETSDPFGNRICYEYAPDPGGAQLLLQRIMYADYGDAPDSFLVRVSFAYEQRPDPYTDCRPGFELRTTRRCTTIRVTTHPAGEPPRPVREYRLAYAADPHNGVSLLRRLDVVGFDDHGTPYDGSTRRPAQLPPLTFGYTPFDPGGRRFAAVRGHDLPARAVGDPGLELVDLHGGGLPDILELNGAARYWRNLGGGRFDLPRPLREAPPHALADPGVQLLDADGDGRMDLLVASGALAGYYPLGRGARQAGRSFQPYPAAPSFGLDDPEVRLAD
ncbi:MAG TPA: SpvB/TcaC N-terminal domain-containing protein, partial [Chloroflexaceae bacterium]|nr:SpvB/TcaC N-terminal domain-containing protein [Chloroflexaceae bacterium]